jgi:hypothetical protein
MTGFRHGLLLRRNHGKDGKDHFLAVDAASAFAGNRARH